MLDTTDPFTIHSIAQVVDLRRTLFVVASPSGTTVETGALLAYFWDKLPDGRHFTAITRLGSPLAALGRDRGFRRVWHDDTSPGARFSALSWYGLVPAALIGVDVERLLRTAIEMQQASAIDSVDGNPGAALGQAIGEAALAGRDKLTLALPAAFATLGYWIELIVAESTGQAGRGILPVEGERLGPPEVYGSDRLFVGVGKHPALDALESPGSRSCGYRLATGIRLAARSSAGRLRRRLPATCSASTRSISGMTLRHAALDRLLAGDTVDVRTSGLREVLESVRPGDYLAIQAFLPRTWPVHEALQTIRLRWRDRYRVATTLGYGPRFLYSTGRLHKEGPDTGVFVQVVGNDSEDSPDLPIPGRPYSFRSLNRAQALGDLEAQRARGRRVTRVTLDRLRAS